MLFIYNVTNCLYSALDNDEDYKETDRNIIR